MESTEIGPQVAVVLPTYNRQEFLKEAIESVLSQSYPHWCLYIVDDASSDASGDILDLFRRHPQVKILENDKNRGVSASRNRAIRASSEDWIALLDSDDYWHPDKLEKQMAFLGKNPEAKLIHCDEIWIRNGRRVNPKKKHLKSGGCLFDQSLKLCAISPSAVLLERSLLNRFGLFREDFPVCEDYDLWLKISAQMELHYLEEALLTKRGGHADQLSRRYFAMDYWRLLSIDDLMQQGALDPIKYNKAREELLRKAQILLKGYRKHGNQKKHAEVESLLGRYR